MEIDRLKRQLGLRVKELRLSKGMKQEDLERWGFSYRYYGKIERGLVNLTLETLERLCKIFEVSLPELFLFSIQDVGHRKIVKRSLFPKDKVVNTSNSTN